MDHSLSQEFEQSARNNAVSIARAFIKAAKQKQFKTWTMSTLALLTILVPLGMGLASPLPLVLIVPPIIMAKNLMDTRKKQKEMQDQFRDIVDSAPDQVRGIVSHELNEMEKTLKELRNGISKKDIDFEKRQLKLLASGLCLFVAPILAVPSFFYLLLKEDSDKTNELIRAADAVIQRNTQPPAPSPSA